MTFLGIGRGEFGFLKGQNNDEFEETQFDRSNKNCPPIIVDILAFTYYNLPTKFSYK